MKYKSRLIGNRQAQQEVYSRKMEYLLDHGRDAVVEDMPENMTGVLAVPMPEERRRRELALAGQLQIAIDMIRNTGPSDLDIRIENAKDMIREFKYTYPETREI